MAPSFAPRERRSSPNVVRRAPPDRPQSKLRVGSAGDPAERQADQMADAVMARLSGSAVADDDSAKRVSNTKQVEDTGRDDQPDDGKDYWETLKAEPGGSRPTDLTRSS
jgi:hypothetical protein